MLAQYIDRSSARHAAKSIHGPQVLMTLVDEDNTITICYRDGSKSKATLGHVFSVVSN